MKGESGVFKREERKLLDLNCSCFLAGEPERIEP